MENTQRRASILQNTSVCESASDSRHGRGEKVFSAARHDEVIQSERTSGIGGVQAVHDSWVCLVSSEERVEPRRFVLSEDEAETQARTV